jgi:spore germination cell wall hydrolase CwlJ-like protein
MSTTDHLGNDMFLARALLAALFVLLTSTYSVDARADNLEEQHQCLALALYWEARGESRHGIVAVGWTILNRTRSQHFPKTPCAVVYQGSEQGPCQFSWWCDGKSDRPSSRDSWITARVIAARLLTDPPPDPTDGALFYHSTSIAVPWKRKRIRTTRIGAHIFYR